MPYSDFYLKPKAKVPVVLYVLTFIAVGGFLATFLRPDIKTTQASKETLVDHSVVNLSSHQAGIYYQTSQPAKSWVLYGTTEDNLERAAFDERDVEKVKGEYNLHLVLLKDLSENTSYTYKIIVDGEVVSVNGSSAFQFKTPRTSISSEFSNPPAYGKVIEQSNKTVDDGFVTFYYPGAYPLVSPIKGGDWLVSLTSLLDRKSGEQILPKTTETVKIVIMNDELKTTSFETLLGNTTPLPTTIIIGTPYGNDKESSVLAANVEVPVSIKPTQVVTQVYDEEIGILFPKNEAVIPGKSPLIKGTSVPNTQISLTLKLGNKSLYTTKLTSDINGDWKLSLPMVLQPDRYSLSMSTKDSSNKTITDTTSFTTTKSGEEVVLGTATEEAKLTPTVAVSTPVPTQIIATVAPTTPVYSSPTPQIQPTVAPTIPATTPPVAGDNNMLVMMGSLALVVVAAGVILLF